MPCDVQALVTAAACDLCSIPAGLVDYVELALLCAIRDGDTTMACDPQTLVSEANCLSCSIPVGLVKFVKLALLCEIAESGGGGGGGSGQIKTYVADPNGEAVLPDDQTKPAIAYAAGGAGPTVTWNTGTLLWQ